MYAGLITLVLFTLWTILLLFALLTARSVLVLTKKHAPNRFDPSGSDMPPVVQRLTRAHANCIESFPWIATPLLLSAALDLNHIVAPLAWFLLAARMAQSLVHLFSTSSAAVQLRFALFLVQLAIIVYWCVMLLQSFLAM